ncbi:replication protein B (plasmid) [Afipia carboxidovorans OM5]|uniref:Replication protein B n=1 Tax=Afipia carboxidovorans (strain ATCC 49405 / DSM 1227 / KCTC 32145 / OM5) TaxID=504832 RepID=Q6LBE0_AFIC5|nr:plasmid partitioning protein RepB [Afipia carboxidovorans]AEI04449.1 replication protein B [Afipia carboxidovorans OM4]AEI08077.1 replication protein B [Afipia carboxidovorans OM5]
MSKGPSKSIVGNFGKFISGEASPSSPAETPSPPRVVRVGAGVIGQAGRSIQQLKDERDRLQELLASGNGGTVDIDPNLVDPSPFDDRLPDDDPETFETFKRSIAEEGQKVPVQVRRSPSIEGRFQIVYGRRRLRAAKELNRPVKALIVELSDRDLVVAQGIENGQRQDLTWIERALFAQTMDEADIKPRDIYAALGIDGAELARMRAVYRAVPVDVIKLIGRAPKVGRPRWGALVAAFGATEGKAAAVLRQTLSADRVSALSSDERFSHALRALSGASTSPQREEMPLEAAGGRPVGKAVFAGAEVRLIVEKSRAEAFTDFLRVELPALMERFDAGDSVTENPAKSENSVS